MSEFTCTKCKISQPLGNYHKRSMVRRGHDSWCKSCKREYRANYYAANPEKELIRSREKAWKLRGIDFKFEDYLELIGVQGGRCAICNSEEEVFDVDHCHESGKVRGLLCGSCNRGLGNFKDKIESLKQAIKYLESK